MNKVDVLKQVIGEVEEKGTVDCQYIEEGTGCMCAVGYVMKAAGVDLDYLLERNLNDETIDRLFENKTIAEPLLDLGFSADELLKLQMVNDDYSDDTERAEAVANYVYDMLREIKEA